MSPFIQSALFAVLSVQEGVSRNDLFGNGDPNQMNSSSRYSTKK